LRFFGKSPPLFCSLAIRRFFATGRKARIVCHAVHWRTRAGRISSLLTGCPPGHRGLANALPRWRFGLVSIWRCASMGIVVVLTRSTGTAVALEISGIIGKYGEIFWLLVHGRTRGWRRGPLAGASGEASIGRCASIRMVVDLAGPIGMACGGRNSGNHWKKWGKMLTARPRPHAGLAVRIPRWRFAFVSIGRCASMRIVVDLAGSRERRAEVEISGIIEKGREK